MSVLTDSDREDPWSHEGRGTVRAALVALGLTVAGFLVSLIGGVAFIVPLLLLEIDIQSTVPFLALTAVGQIGFLVLGYAYARYAGLTVHVSRPTARELGWGLVGVVAALVVAIVASAVLAALDLVPGSVLGEAVVSDPNLVFGLAALSIVLVAPAEEFLFRGVIQGRLRRSVGPVGAVVGSSLLFGSLHLGNYTGETAAVVAGAVLIACVGSVFGVLYERTENLVVPVVAHGVYNTILMVLSYLTL
jgi:membrane protease YdiL (CAAX protease family)